MISSTEVSYIFLTLTILITRRLNADVPVPSALFEVRAFTFFPFLLGNINDTEKMT